MASTITRLLTHLGRRRAGANGPRARAIVASALVLGLMAIVLTVCGGSDSDTTASADGGERH